MSHVVGAARRVDEDDWHRQAHAVESFYEPRPKTRVGSNPGLFVGSLLAPLGEFYVTMF